jgi:hypothetical protein
LVDNANYNQKLINGKVMENLKPKFEESKYEKPKKICNNCGEKNETKLKSCSRFFLIINIRCKVIYYCW